MAQQDHVADLVGGILSRHPNPHPERLLRNSRGKYRTSLRPGRNRPGRMALRMVKKTASIEEVLAAIEAARDKVMADEVKSLTKLGIPKAMASQLSSSRVHHHVCSHEDAARD